MQHDVYAKTTQQASRLVLIVTEAEVRDRLFSSKINKLLYRYSSNELPFQSHAGIVSTCSL